MLVVGGTGTASINTGNGAALVFGGAGTAAITGGTGSLQLLVGSGRAVVTEGSGAAVYDVVKGAAGGTDILNGFKVGSDKIDLFGYTSADQHIVSAGGSTILSLTDGTNITLIGVADPKQSIIG